MLDSASPLWSDATPMGSYLVVADTTTKTIYPKNPTTGKSCRVVLISHWLHLRHTSGVTISFRRYKHQNRWYFGDTRAAKSGEATGSITCDILIGELSRMLFAGDRKRAMEFAGKTIGA